MDQPLISVIVPIYRVEPYLDRCVRSITEQTYQNLEIILVDDGSPDNCPAMCDAWAEKDPRIKVIHKENGGVSDARNAGISAAAGEWLLFVDSDDIVSRYLVDALVKASTKKTLLTAAGYVRFNTEPPADNAVISEPEYIRKQLHKCRGGLYCFGALYNRELVRSIGLWFDTSLQNIEDVAWNGVYLRYVEAVEYISTTLYYYRVNPTSITSRCTDVPWQINSWFAARRSMLNWFVGKSLTEQQKKEIRELYRYCQNNIYAECMAKGITYRQFRQLERMDAEKAPWDEMLLNPAENALRNNAPWVYFHCYLLALYLRKFLKVIAKWIPCL